MTEMALWSLTGAALVPAALAFGATLYRKKGTQSPPVTSRRRLLSVVVIYAVCFVTLLILTLLIEAISTPDPGVIGSFSILSGIAGYYAGKRVVKA